MDIIIIDLATTTTLLHEAIANHSQSDGVDIGVLYFNEKKYRSSTVSSKFYIKLKNSEQHALDLSDIYELIENKGGITLSRALYLDRYISDKKILRAYYDNFIYRFHNLLLTEKPTTVVGELSLGWELLAYGLCKALNINYLLPLNTYLLSKPRFALFDITHDISIIDKLAASSSSTIDKGELDALIEKRRSVDVNKGFGDKLRAFLDINLINRFIYNSKMYDSGDYREDLFSKLNFRLRNKFNSRRNQRYLLSNGVDDLNSKYFLIMLHVQPEVTPDTTATFFSNQIELIRQACLRLPFGYSLFVKEHPNGLGCRSLQEIKEIASLPNVYLLKNSVSSSDAIKSSSGVISVCGTGSFEAALHGVKAAVFNDVYFSNYPGIRKLKNYDELTEFFKGSGAPKSSVQNLDVMFFEKILKGTFDCFWHQPMLMPGVLEDQNVKKLREAIVLTHTLLS